MPVIFSLFLFAFKLQNQSIKYFINSQVKNIKNTRCAARIHNKVSETFSSKVITLPVEDCRLAVESLCFK